MKLAIFGTGKMGGALGRQLAASGYEVVFGSRDPEANRDKFKEFTNIRVTSYGEAADESPVVAIAVPWLFTLDLLSGLKECFNDKIIVDMTNPLSPDVSHLLVGGNDSSAEQIANLLPASRVVKAFNGVTADNLPQPLCHDEKTQVFYCSDHQDARDVASQMIADTGYEAVDCGAFTNARYLEAMAMLWLQLAFWEDRGNDLRFKMVC